MYDHLPLQELELRRIKTIVPAHIYQNFNPSVKLQQGLRRRAASLSAQQRSEVEHNAPSGAYLDYSIIAIMTLQ